MNEYFTDAAGTRLRLSAMPNGRVQVQADDQRITVDRKVLLGRMAAPNQVKHTGLYGSSLRIYWQTNQMLGVVVNEQRTAYVPPDKLREMYNRVEEAGNLADADNETADLRAKVEAARELVEHWRRYVATETMHPGATRSRVDAMSRCADALSAVLDPPPMPAVVIECRCGERIDVFQRNGIVDVVGPLSEHFETCPAVES